MSRPFVDEVFEAVFGLDPAGRDAALGRLCEGHPSLERETRALLRAADAAPVEELVEGAVLGDYRLVEKLGVGGTASVWRAFDRHLQAWTALKVLHPRKGDALDAVLREARAASAIISDHVVRIRTAGRAPSGRSFIEMQLAAEYRRGEDGAEVLVVGRSLADAPPDGERDLARCVAEAARGVDAAHRVGVLHRDLKPANLLRLPVSRRVLVTDFGLAVAPVHQPPAEGLPATATVSVVIGDGVIVGTPPFLSPEVVRGEAPGRASDVYALGATAYACLVGRPPYVATGIFSPVPALDVVEQIRRGPPPDVRAAARAAGRRVSARLARIVDAAMARDPAARPRDAIALAEDLEAWLADRPTRLDGRDPFVASGLLAWRHRGLVGTALVLGSMLAGSALALRALDAERAALDARRAALEIAVTEASGRREAAEIQAASAEQVRERAEREKDEAVAEAIAAMEAREAAQKGQSAAERAAAAAIGERRRAEQARALAIAGQVDAERDREDALDALVVERGAREVAEARLADTSRDLREARAALDAARIAAAEAARQRDAVVEELTVLRGALEVLPAVP